MSEREVDWLENVSSRLDAQERIRSGRWSGDVGDLLDYAEYAFADRDLAQIIASEEQRRRSSEAVAEPGWQDV